VELLEQITKTINEKTSKMVKQISIKLEKQNTVFVTQNSKLTKEILDQSLKNHGTINEKFNDLVMYQFLVTLRENLIAIKTTLDILETLDKSQSKIFHNLYLKYHRLHPHIPILDVTQGIIIVKILFPTFFVNVLSNLSLLKNQFDEKTAQEIEITIKNCDSLFQKIDKSKLTNLKTSLEFFISEIDKKIIKLIDIKN